MKIPLFQVTRTPSPDAVENECIIHKNVELACLLIGRDLDAEWADFNAWSKITSANRTADSVYTYKSAALYRCLPWDSSVPLDGDSSVPLDVNTPEEE